MAHNTGFLADPEFIKPGKAGEATGYLDFTKTNKKFYLLDTFEGLADELLTDKEINRKKFKINTGIVMARYCKRLKIFRS